MRTIKIAIILCLFAEVSFATTCLKQLKNCTGVSAKRRFLDWTPVCVLDVECDVYCGSMKFDKKQETTYYCAFQSIKGDIYTCMSPDKCGDDTTLIKSEKDIDRLTRNPVSSGAGMNTKKEETQGSQQ